VWTAAIFRPHTCACSPVAFYTPSPVLKPTFFPITLEEQEPKDRFFALTTLAVEEQERKEHFFVKEYVSVGVEEQASGR
jgi:hypothetical protein